jgi:hypothetical protein
LYSRQAGLDVPCGKAGCLISIAMERNSTIIYRSFHEAIQTLPNKEDRADMWDAICSYTFDLKEPQLDGVCRAMFMLMRPVLNTCIKNWKNGTVPKNKQKGSQSEAKDKPKRSETEVKDKPTISQPEAYKDKDKEEKEKKEKKEKEIFEEARKLYPGVKLGLDTEWSNYIKKHKNHSDITPILSQVITQQINSRKEMKRRGHFVAELKHFKTWINNSCWDEELPSEDALRDTSDRPREAGVLTQEEVYNAHTTHIYGPDWKIK